MPVDFAGMLDKIEKLSAAFAQMAADSIQTWKLAVEWRLALKASKQAS